MRHADGAEDRRRVRWQDSRPCTKGLCEAPQHFGGFTIFAPCAGQSLGRYHPCTRSSLRLHGVLQALTEIRKEIALKEWIDPANPPPLRFVMQRTPRVRD